MKHLKILFLLMFATSLYSMDSDNIDHQRTPQERTLRVERINTYLKEIVEHEARIEEAKHLNPKLEHAIKVGNISLKFLDIYKNDIINILSKLYSIQDEFKTIYFSDDARIKDFKEMVRTLHKHRHEESSMLAQEGCTATKVEIYLNGHNSFIHVQNLNFSAFNMDEFESLLHPYASRKVNDFFTSLKSKKDVVEDMYISSSGDVQKLNNYLAWNKSQIEIFNKKKKGNINLIHKNIDWFNP